MIDKILLNVPHHSQGKFNGKDAGILSLVFFEDVCLDRSPYI